ncbi:MAG: hypothetical protein ABIF40_04160 [archaeon]
MLREQKEVLTDCKRCGEKVSPNSFKIDFNLGVMTCPKCSSQKNVGKNSRLEFMQEEEFDVFHGYKKTVTNKVRKIEGKDFIRYVCKRCSYPFKFDLIKQYPSSCPYCGVQLEKITLFSE